MSMAPGVQVWVKCDDGEWWPAKVCAVSEEVRPFLGDGEDGCVEFYHDPGQLYPVATTNPMVVQALHALPSQRTAAEADRFARASTRDAVARALRDAAEFSRPSPPAPRSPHLPGLSRDGRCEVDFTADELHNIRQLLAAVSSRTASQLGQSLGELGADLSRDALHRRGARERAVRKRARVDRSVVTTQQLLEPRPGPPHTVATPAAVTPALATGHASGGVAAPGSASVSREDESEPSGDSDSPAPASSRTWSASGAPGRPVAPFVPSADASVLEILRVEVFDNAARFVLSPVYRFLDVLGAVSVDNADVHTTLPSPRGVREMPEGGFAADRRVLLVPLTEAYDHNSGWLQPLRIDGGVLAMRLAVNGRPVAVPANWPLTAGKEATAVRSAPVADITDEVMGSGGDLFSLDVSFTQIPDDTALWSGIVVCVFAEELPITTVAEQIVANYRKPAQATPASRLSGRPRSASTSARGGAVGDRDVAVDVTEAYVRVQCPLTTLPMEIPVRGAACEHLQCMELLAVLAQCARSNLWNCPLCGAPVRPRDLCVNHRLSDWIEAHRGALGKVEYVMETPFGQPMKVQYKSARHEHVVVVEIDDDGDA